ncbi:MAG: phytanoyl-CoA dioxygenase family protein [Planctomycetota bacterium]
MSANPHSSSHESLRDLDVPPHDSPFLDEFLASGHLSDSDADALGSLAKDGYVVVDLDPAAFEPLADEILRDVAPMHAREGNRVPEAWYESEAVARLAAHPEVMRFLGAVYQRRPIPFQTLNFERGTEQAAHSDTIHFHCVPRHFMCGVWVPLEDIGPDCGPLVVYPGSHRLPTYGMSDLGLEPRAEAYGGYEERVREILESSGYEPHAMTVERGQAIVWSANLFHGGSAVHDPSLTRKSQVTHYYFGDGLYYLPMASDLVEGRVCHREVIDISTDQFVTPRYRGRDVEIGRERNVQSYPRPLPGRVSVPPRSLRDLPARVLHGVSKTWETMRHRGSSVG